MVLEFKFPDVGEGITEGEIVSWKVKVGDRVKQDQVLAEVETDKAVVEMPSPRPGTILKLHHRAGDTIKVGDVLVTIGDRNEKPAAPPAPKKAASPTTAPAERPASVVGDIPETMEQLRPRIEKTVETVVSERTAGTGTRALPAVRRLARELGVVLESVSGSGSGGRITEEDVRAAANPIRKEKVAKGVRVTKKYDMWGYISREPLKGIRKATARHMSEAVSRAALVSSTDEADVTKLWDIREQEKWKAKTAGVHLTITPFVVKALVLALKAHPSLNASLDEETEELILKKYYNIGIAVDFEGGLMVPVVKGADQKSILQLGKEIQLLAKKVRSRKIDLMDMKGGSFTVTNFGVLGGFWATPIPNYPEAAILGLGRIHELPRVVKECVEVRKVLPLSLTFDHRILDGAEAQRFVNDLKKYLEDPGLLLVEK